MKKKKKIKHAAFPSVILCSDNKNNTFLERAIKGNEKQIVYSNVKQKKDLGEHETSHD